MKKKSLIALSIIILSMLLSCGKTEQVEKSIVGFWASKSTGYLYSVVAEFKENGIAILYGDAVSLDYTGDDYYLNNIIKYGSPIPGLNFATISPGRNGTYTIEKNKVYLKSISYNNCNTFLIDNEQLRGEGISLVLERIK